MLILKLIKNSGYFYSIMALTFIVFVVLILFSGRKIYDNEKEKLFQSKINELNITKTAFENKLDDVELELRRLVNIMNQQDLLANPDPVSVKSFASDFLFDHNYLSIVIANNAKKPVLDVTSDTYPPKYRSFINSKPADMLKNISFAPENVNKLLISKKLNAVYLVKYLINSEGEKNRYIVFFFAPDFLLQQLPLNYALLSEKGDLSWAPPSGSFPAGFKLPSDTGGTNHIHLSDTKAVFFLPLSEKSLNYMLAAVVDTAPIKKTLMFSTVTTISVFSVFFLLVFLLIHLRNMQINHLIDTQKATVVCLANLAEFKDNETADHLERTRHYGSLLAAHLRKRPGYRKKISREFLSNIGFASVLHDIGKVGVPDAILKKPGKLTSEEFEVIKQHTVFAKDILKELVQKHRINDIFFNLSYNIAAYHHEKWDGGGYPKGLKEDDIPLEARIFAICDVYDALRSERAYKKPFSHTKSMEIIREGRGSHFDPDITDAFCECAEQFRQIHDTYILFYNQIAYSSFGNNKRELRVEWTSALAVGIETIDEQHKILLSKINFLIKSILEGKGEDSVINILNFLNTYIEDHFIEEEMIMAELNTPDLLAHKNAHNRFRKNFSDLRVRIKTEGIDNIALIEIEKNLIAWLLNHITEMDLKIKPRPA